MCSPSSHLHAKFLALRLRQDLSTVKYYLAFLEHSINEEYTDQPEMLERFLRSLEPWANLHKYLVETQPQITGTRNAEFDELDAP